MEDVEVKAIGVQDALDTAQSIGDLGMSIVTAGFFLILSMIMMIVMFRWFKKLIDGIVDGQSKTMDKLLDETRIQNETLEDMREALSPENLSRTKVISSLMFDLSVYQVCDLIEMIREQNHIDDTETIHNKVITLVSNVHEDRNSKLDNFRYRGRKLSEYTNKEWQDRIVKLIETEIYSFDNRKRMETNVREAYKKIKIEFYRNLREA